MKLFTQLFTALDSTTRTNEKVAALERYFRLAPPADAAWALRFLIGKRPPRAVTTTQLRGWVALEAGLPLWLVDECYEAVGDLAETLALLLPPDPHPKAAAGSETSLTLAALIESRLLPLGALSDASRHELLRRTWRELPDPRQRFLWHKLIGGSFRVGVSRTLVSRALANIAGLSPAVVAHRLLGEWQPGARGFQRLMSSEDSSPGPGRPYPFFLACPVESNPADLGDLADWQIEWKWDGIRAQLIRRAGQTLLWSRGEELVTDAFPEIAEAGKLLPDGTVLDGEILAWHGEAPLPFAQLQRRLGRKAAGETIRRQVPVAFMAYDVLEAGGADVRARPLSERREMLAALVTEAHRRLTYDEASRRTGSGAASQRVFAFAQDEGGKPDCGACALRLSPALRFAGWPEVEAALTRARSERVEGVMLKRRDSAYGVGREKGEWWKWKTEPYTLDAVLLAAQAGHGKRASLYTDYTFGVWHEGRLVPVAKAYSGLSDAEIDEVDAFVRRHTLDKRGPVRIVAPKLVFELAFEGIQRSARHKSGVAVRFPRIHRWRQDKRAEEADTLATLLALAGEATTRTGEVARQTAPRVPARQETAMCSPRSGGGIVH
jgi:DNA ligase-1